MFTLIAGGGGIANFPDGEATLTNCTLWGNWTFADGDGILNLGTMWLDNTIVAHSRPGPDVESGYVDIDNRGSLTGFNNLIETGDGLNLDHDLIATIFGRNPQLDPLGDYGGPTWTHRLRADSPAIDAGDDYWAEQAGLTTDQRGEPRRWGSHVDIGADEDQSTVLNQAPTITPLGPQTTYENVDLHFAAISVADADDQTLTVTLEVSHGTLTLETTEGLTIVGNSSGTVLLSGSITALNTALGQLVYRSALNYNGTDTLSITASDGSLSTSASMAINVQTLGNLLDAVNAQVGNLPGKSGLAKLKNLKGNATDILKVQALLNQIDGQLSSPALSADLKEQLEALRILVVDLLESLQRRYGVIR